MTSVRVVLPIRTVSEANVHADWRIRLRRARDQRDTAALALRGPLAAFREALATSAHRLPESPPQDIVVAAIGRAELPHYAVTMTRIAPKRLDSDNLASSQKHVRDGVADALGINDRDSRVVWLYTQRRDAKWQYAVEIVMTETRLANRDKWIGRER